jgi:hypothetical protein
MLASWTLFNFKRDKISIEEQRVVILSEARIQVDFLVLVPITKNSYCFPELLNFFVSKPPPNLAPF